MESLGSISFSLFPILERFSSAVGAGVCLECRAFQECSVRQMWGCSVPGWSVNLVPWLLGRCKTCMLGTDLTVRQAQDPVYRFSAEMSLLPEEGGPFRSFYCKLK